MTLPLATRGYICFGRRGPAARSGFGRGPDVVETEEVQPEIDAAGTGIEEVPSIVGGDVQEASLVGSAELPDPAQDAPSIVGGVDLTPTVDSGEEE